MIQFTRLTGGFATAALFLAQFAMAQTAPTGSISGRVLSEEGRALRATVALNLAAARGYPAPPRRVLTGPNGTFTFTKLPAAQYVLCAQVASSEATSANSPYVDTCVWPSTQPPITLAAGQQLAGIVFTAPKGAWLKLHVADPDKVLPQPAANGPAPIEPELQFMLKGPEGLNRHARFDSSGRNYQVAVPLRTTFALRVTSTAGNVFDQGNKQVKDQDEVGFNPATPNDLNPINFTLHKK
jgi:hypothetical protein